METAPIKNTPKVGAVVGRNARGGIDKVSNREQRAAIIPAKMTAETPAAIPTVPEPTPLGSSLATNNAAIAPSLGMTIDEKGNLIKTDTAAPDTFQSLMESVTGQRMDAFNEMGTAEGRLQALQAETGIKQKEALYQSLTNRLNGINTDSQSKILKNENFAERNDVTKSVFNAQTSRIERDAAIRALPIQAELAIASGDLNSARQYISDMSQVQAQDAQNMYQFKSSLIDSVYTFATQQEQRRLDAIKDKENKAFEMMKTNLSMKDDWAKMATQSGQSSLAGEMMKLDPSSETFSTDLAKLQGQVVDTTSALQRDSLRANIAQSYAATAKSNYELSQLKDPTNRSSSLDGKPLTQTQQKVRGFADRLSEAEKVLKESDKFSSFFSVGGSMPNLLKTEDRQKFEQARRNFINAVLRTESGAVISDEEFANAEQQYFPQRGDSDGVLSQKAANRNTVINNFYREANVPRPVGVGDIIESEGIRYKVAEDGVTLIEL